MNNVNKTELVRQIMERKVDHSIKHLGQKLNTAC